MPNKIVAAYDGSDSGARAVHFAKARAVKEGATLIIVHVLEWSPYSFLTPQEIEERHARRKEELARAETAVMGPILEKLGDEVAVETEVKFGQVAETISSAVATHGASELIIGRQGNSGIAQRIFGSSAGKIAQLVDVPCTIVP